MTRRELLGCLVLIALVLVGRGVRHALLVDPAGGWRDPGWLEAYLPALPPEQPPEPPPAKRSSPPARPLDPNTSPVDSLILLPGIGPALAERIVAARAEGVHFARARDLQAVRGIGPRLVERLTPYLYFSQTDSSNGDPRHSAR